MKHLSIIALLVILFTDSIFSQNMFTDAKWGESISAVSSKDKLNYPIIDGDMGGYSMIYDQEFMRVYQFDDNKLHSVVSSMKFDYLMYDKILDLYNKIKIDLSNVYGAPIRDEVLLDNGVNKDAEGELLVSYVVTGYGSVRTNFKNGDTYISMSLKGFDMEGKLTVTMLDNNQFENYEK